MKQTEPKKYEEAVARLEEIADVMEQGSLSLDESIALYEESVRLADFCSKKLQEFKGKIEYAKENGEGQDE